MHEKLAFFFWKPLEPNELPHFFWGDKNFFSAFYGFLAERHSKIAVFGIFCPIGQKGLFSPNFNSKYLSDFFPYRNDQGMESPLKLTNFLKMLPKRAFHTDNTPKTTNDKTQIFEIWGFLGFVICGFGCVVGAKTLFGNIFRKLVNFRGLSIS